MPDYPDEALTAAAEAMQQREHMFGEDPWTCNARVALDAAAPILAEAVAQKILAHMETHWPGVRPSDVTGDPNDDLITRGRSSWRRHFQIAARVAAGAFTTEAESKRMAAEALAAGQFAHCDIPEDGVPRDA